MQLNDTELVEIDLNLNLTSEQSKLTRNTLLNSHNLYCMYITVLHYQSYHIYGGIPQGGGGSGSCLLTNKDSVNKYSTALHIPLWNAYRLNKNVCDRKMYCYLRTYHIDVLNIYKVIAYKCKTYYYLATTAIEELIGSHLKLSFSTVNNIFMTTTIGILNFHTKYLMCKF